MLGNDGRKETAKTSCFAFENIRIVPILILAAVVLMAGVGVVSASEVYTIAHISDTQRLADYNPDILNSTYQYLETMKTTRNLQAIIHTGDHVDSPIVQSEWQSEINARSYTTLPIYDVGGNHDLLNSTPVIGQGYYNWTPYITAIPGAYQTNWSSTIKNFTVVGTSYNTFGTPSVAQLSTSLSMDSTIFNPLRSALSTTKTGTNFPIYATHYYGNTDNLSQQFNVTFVSSPTIVLSGHVYGNEYRKYIFNGTTIIQDIFSPHITEGTPPGKYSGVRIFNVSVNDDGTVGSIRAYTQNIYPNYQTGDYYVIYGPGGYAKASSKSTNTSLIFYMPANVTPFTDESGKGHTITNTGSVAVDSSTPKFGQGSAQFANNTVNTLNLDGASDLAFGINDFSISLWFNKTGNNSNQMPLIDFRPTATNGFYPKISVDPDGKILYIVNGSTTISSSAMISTNRQYYLSLSKVNNVTKLSIDGNVVGTPYIDNSNYIVGSNRPMMGNSGSGASEAGQFPGDIDDIVIMSGNGNVYNGSVIPDTEYIRNPYAQFELSNISGMAPVVVTLTNLSVGNIDQTSLLWGYQSSASTGGDGIWRDIGYGTQKTISFGSSGNYTINLTAINPFGKSVAIGWVNVSPSLAPLAQFTPTTPTVTYPNGQQFTDTSTGSPTAWNWSFGDGNLSSLQNPTYAWTAPGVYTVSLTASNVYGSSTNSTTVTVLPPMVSSSFTQNNYGGQVPLDTQFTFTGANATTWNWSYQNLTAPSRTYFSTIQNPLLSLSHIGNYSIWLNATGYGGYGLSNSSSWVNATNTTYSASTKVNYITINPLSIPSPSFVANKTYTTNSTLAVMFNFTGSNPQPISHSWNFGDGFTSSEKNTTHTYSDYGKYTVISTATNAAGSVSNTSVDAIVLANTLVEAQPLTISKMLNGVEPIRFSNVDHADKLVLNVSYNKTALSLQSISLNSSASGWSLSNTINSGSGTAYIGLSGIDKSISTNTSVVDLTWLCLDTSNATAYVTINPSPSYSWIIANSSYIPVTNQLPYANIINGNISTQNTTYTKVLTFENVYTHIIITGLRIGIDYTGVINGTANTDTGTYSLSSTYGNITLVSYADGYYNSTTTVVFDNNNDQTIYITPLISPQVPNIIYNAQLYRLVFKNLVGTPLANLSVVVTPTNLTMPSNWVNQLIGISPNADIVNGVLYGTTAYDGSFGAPMLTPLEYSVHVYGLSLTGETVNYTLPLYPPSSGQDIFISLPTSATNYAQVTPTPAFITYNIYNQSISNTTQVLSVNYDDPMCVTNYTSVVVSNQSGYILNSTIYTGSTACHITNNFTYADNSSPDGDILKYGFSAYVSTAGGWNNISETHVSNNVGSSLTGSAEYDSWAAIIIIVIVSSAFTASSVYAGTVGVGMMGLFFYYSTRWFSPGVAGGVFIAMCVFWICIGAIGIIAKRARSVF